MRAHVQRSRNLLAIAPLCAALLMFAPGATAEVLDLPADNVAGEQLERPATPTRGMSKSSVQQRFGTPNSKIAAIGDPPISRWIYDEYTVVFEYDTVLHAVVPEAPPPIYRSDELVVAD